MTTTAMRQRRPLAVFGRPWLLPLCLINVLYLTTVSASANEESPKIEEQVEQLLADLTANTQEMHGQVESRAQGFLHDMESMQEEYDKMVQETYELESVIGRINTYYVEKLGKELNDTIEKELAFRRGPEMFEEDDEEEHENENENNEFVSKKELDKVFDLETMLRKSEEELEAWVKDLIRAEIEEQVKEQLHLIEEAVPPLQQQSKADLKPEACATPVDAVHAVQDELTKHVQDQIGRYDHASTATVVYSATSDTFVPQAAEAKMLGNVWWRRYIPQDWERLLPDGWEHWNTGVPHYVYHTLGWRTSSAPASPEQILFANTHPGSCWPMAGRHGQVTLRLPHPVEIDAVTIDHVSSLLIPTDSSRSSAPKQIRIVGYPPCEDDGKNGCNGMGFDWHDPVELATVEYDLDGKSTQTFSLVDTKQGEKDESESDDDSDDNDDDEFGGGSCSAVTASCSAPPLEVDAPSKEAEVVSGITLQILDNWGNDDYTCLYRFRVHGDAM